MTARLALAVALGVMALSSVGPAWALDGPKMRAQTAATQPDRAPPPPPPVPELSGAPIATAPPRAQLHPLEAPLFIDDVTSGAIEVEARMNGELKVNARALSAALAGRIAAALRDLILARADADGLIDAPTLSAIGLETTFDPAKLAVSVQTPLDQAPVAVISASGVAQPDPRRSLRPAFVSGATNIALTQPFTGHRAEPVGVDVAGFATIGGRTAVTMTYGGSWSEADSEWRRAPLRLSHDDFDRAIRYTAGEITSRSYGFQSVPNLKGIAIGRAYESIRPFQPLYATGSTKFALERAAQVTIETDGQKQTLNLARGQYDVRDLVGRVGRNSVRVTAEDSAGVRAISTFTLWSEPELLAPGVSDFSVAAGVIDDSSADARAAAGGFYRAGLTERLTGSVGFEQGRKGWRAQLEGTTSRAGLTTQVGTAVSAVRGRTGAAVSATVQQRLDFGPQRQGYIYGTAFAADSRFADPYGAGLRTSEASQWRTDLGASYTAGATNLTLGWSRARAARSATSGLFARALRTIGPLMLGAGFNFRDTGGKGDLEGELSIRLRTGPRGAPVTLTATGREFGADIYRMGQVDRLGAWTASGSMRVTADARRAIAAAAYDANRFRISGAIEAAQPPRSTSGARTSSTVTLGTAIAFADGAFAIGRPVTDAFLIAARHPSLATATAVIGDGAMRGSFNGHGRSPPIAKSGLLGPPLVSVRPYVRQSVDVMAENLPFGYDLDERDPDIVAAYGRGYVVRLGRDAWHAAVGTLMSPDGPVANVRLQIVEAGASSSASPPPSAFTNAGGRFYARGLRVGAYDIRIGDRTVARFVIPKDAAALIDVGVLDVPAF